MKKLLIICSLAVFLSGCILVSSEKKELSKESAPPVPVATTKPGGPVSPPTVRAPSKGELLINIAARYENNATGNYQWAEIYLDDNFIGSSDLLQLSLEPGQHKITVTATGYKCYEKIITILPARTAQQLNILLEKE